MKKTLSFILALVLCFALNIPALAVDLSEDGTVTRVTSDMSSAPDEFGRVMLSEEECVAFDSSKYMEISGEQEENNNEVAPRLGYVGASIAEITGRPLMLDVTTGELFVYPSIGLKVTYTTNMSQSSSLRLTSAQANGLYNEAISYLNNHIPDATHTYALVGWHIETLVQLRSDNPKYIEWRVAEPNFGINNEYTKANIPLSICSYRINGVCGFPSNYSETEYYHIDGIEGKYYYGLTDGRVLGIPFSAGIAINV